MAEHIYIQSYSLVIQDKKCMYKIKSRALSEKSAINAELQTTIATVKKINQDHIRSVGSFKKQVERIRKLMFNTPSLEQW